MSPFDSTTASFHARKYNTESCPVTSLRDSENFPVQEQTPVIMVHLPLPPTNIDSIVPPGTVPERSRSLASASTTAFPTQPVEKPSFTQEDIRGICSLRAGGHLTHFHLVTASFTFFLEHETISITTPTLLFST
ncbi:hypothetical protein BDQ17DRAFT_1435312 [Cyathus striatus]|nr:hypothetical protein BDQ17DRAFT_1435312 [Cyathus striatus]